jgi:hypothetical protein
VEALTDFNAARTATLSAKIKKKLALLLTALPQRPPRATPPPSQAAAILTMLTTASWKKLAVPPNFGKRLRKLKLTSTRSWPR